MTILTLVLRSTWFLHLLQGLRRLGYLLPTFLSRSVPLELSHTNSPDEPRICPRFKEESTRQVFHHQILLISAKLLQGQHASGILSMSI